MKKVILAVLSLYFGLAVNAQVFSQDELNLLSEVKYIVADEERAVIEESEAKFSQADEIYVSVKEEDAELEKYFKKGSTPKAEKKSINVKVKRVTAAGLQETAFNRMHEVLSSRLKRLTFYFPSEKKEAKKLRNSSLIKAEQAIARGDDYKYLDDKDFAEYPYESLKTAIDESNSLFHDAIVELLDGYAFYLDQDRKREEMGEDEFQWKVATDKNRYSSYSKYLEEMPEGVHFEEAHTRMQQIDPEKYALEMAASTGGDLAAASSSPAAESGTETTAVAAAESSDAETATVAATNVSSASETVAVAETAADETFKSTKSNAPSNDVFAVTSVAKSADEEKAAASSYSAPKTSSTPVASAQSVPGAVFRLQFIAVSRQMSIEEAKEISGSNQTVVEFQEGGLYKYALGEFSTYVEAKDFKKQLGIQTFVVGFKDGSKVGLQQLLGR